MKWQEQRPLGASQLSDLARKAATAAPDRPEVWLALGRMLQRHGHPERAADLLEPAVERLPGSARLRSCLAEAYAALGRFEAALEQAEQALRIDRSDRSARLLQFSLLSKAGRREEVERLADEVARLNPLEPDLFEIWAHQADSPEALRRLADRCDAALGEGRLCTNAVYFRALALARLGRDAEAREALPIDPFLEVRDLDGDAAFREALAAEILRNPTLVPDPRGKATRGGRQTRQLRQKDAPATDRLLGRIRESVDDYCRRLPPQSGLALVRPATARLDAWAVVYGADGQQSPHRHARGWISGVYYAAAPRPAGAEGYRGPLRLGAISELGGTDPPWGIRDIEPVPGRLVLFPSYVPHATEASGVDGARISVAFDVVPVEP